MQAAIPSLPKRVKAQVLSIDPAATVILFGSRARGDARMDSDWDFLVLLERPLTIALKNKIRDELYDLELLYNEVISARIHERKAWEQLEITPLYQNIKREGTEV